MAANKEFNTWLNSKLRELNTDETVFGSYISGILEGDETNEEKREALEGILSEMLTDNIEELLQTILDKWYANAQKKDDEAPAKALDIKVEEQLAKLLEKTKVQAVVKERQYTEEEKRIREQILAQYSQTPISDDEYEPAQSDEEPEKHAGTSTSSGLERNTNFSDVVALQKEKREQARNEAAAKKQKDKEDREKQKQLREEKKEKRKTVKGERRR